MGEHKNEGLEILKAIRQIAKLIQAIEDEITVIYSKLTSTTVKPKEVDVQTSLPADPMGDQVAEVIEYQEKLEAYKKELCEKKVKALITIKRLSVEDQRLLLARYFKGMSVEKVAEEMEWSYYWTWQKLHTAEENFCNNFSLVDRS